MQIEYSLLSAKAFQQPQFLSWTTHSCSFEQWKPEHHWLQFVSIERLKSICLIWLLLSNRFQVVDIYTAFNLSRVKRVRNSHSTFITGLEFLPTGEQAAICRAFKEASVVSISVDHQVVISQHAGLVKPLVLRSASITYPSWPRWAP